MTKRVLLTKPTVKFPVKKQGYGGDVGIPLNLLYLAAHLRKNSDVEITVKDYRLEQALGKKRDLQKDFADYDIIATGACTVESPDADHMMHVAKEMGKTTVYGGIYPSFNSERVLSSGVVDYVVRGEGEIPFTALINALQKGKDGSEIRGISFMKDKNVVNNPRSESIENLDDLEFPAYDLINLQDYIPLTSGAIYSSRGCNKRCNFCTLNKMWGFSYRHRSVENILEELDFLSKVGFKRVHFKDESVTLDAKFAEELFEGLASANLGLKYKVKSRINQASPNLLSRMVRAGVDTIHTGIESVSQDELIRINKGISAESIYENIKNILESGLKLNPVYILGLPGQTESDLKVTSEFIEEVGSNPNVITYMSFMTPHPGTVSEKDLRILTQDFSRYTHKQPVCYPESLGYSGFRMMIDKYHELAEKTGTTNVNPPVDESYLKIALKKAENLKSDQLMEELIAA